MSESNWTGDLSRNLDELAAFDAMRAFLEDYWERGLRGDDGLANLLSNLNRSVWADGGPGDSAMWQDWKRAVALIRKARDDALADPLRTGVPNGS